MHICFGDVLILRLLTAQCALHSRYYILFYAT